MPSGQQPPPSYGPPAYWPAYPSTPRPRRAWLPWVIIASVLVVGGCGAVFATVGVRASHDLRDARAAANSFLSAVERGDTDRAQDLMCFEASPGSVNTAMGAGVTSHRITGVSVQSGFGSQGRKTASVTADLTVGDSRHRREVLTIVHEQDSWLVCGVFYVPLG